jgi:diacylglycerol kinase family enzyme
VDAIVDGRPRGVDLGEVNGRVFLNNAAVGLYPRYVQERGDCPHGGFHGMALRSLALARAIARQPAFDLHLEVEGRRLALPTRLVVVGNDPYTFGGLRLARRRRVDAGVLGFYVVPGASRAALARALWHAERGAVSGAIEVLVGRTGTLTVPGLGAITLDGEVVPLSGPLTFRSLPGALQVYAVSEPQRPVV